MVIRRGPRFAAHPAAQEDPLPFVRKINPLRLQDPPLARQVYQAIMDRCPEDLVQRIRHESPSSPVKDSELLTKYQSGLVPKNLEF